LLISSSFFIARGAWQNIQGIHVRNYICAYCGDKVAADRGYGAAGTPQSAADIAICPNCGFPTLFTGPLDSRIQIPESSPGSPVPNVPSDLDKLYNEARACAAAGAYTGSVLLCRKSLMNIAVQEGAKEGQTFQAYVEYLSEQGFIPPRGKGWVDYIRKRGNEATHQIAIMSKDDAVALIAFVEMLLRFIYEFPQMIPLPLVAQTKGS